MNLLIDTHSLIWFLNGDEKLSLKSREAIESQVNLKFVSIASIWEIAIKISLGRFSFDKGFKEFLGLLDDNGFGIIPITVDHALTVSTLKFIHRDPFDRLIVAQAMTDNMTVVTKDEEIKKYEVKTLW
jgi:PIN domain nuclease of toxin-antitoxin system